MDYKLIFNKMDYKLISFLALAFIVGLLIGLLIGHGCGDRDGHGKKYRGVEKGYVMNKELKKGYIHDGKRRQHEKEELEGKHTDDKDTDEQ